MTPELRKRVKLSNPWHLLAFGFGSGLAPKMPGTWGSLAALPIVIGAYFLGDIGYLAVTLLSILFGILICQRAADDLGVHDHGSIVWDEVAGMLITYALLPQSIAILAIGFVLFRFFDIVKPWPIKFVDAQVPGGLGIMLDDVIAGAMACLCLHLLIANTGQALL